MAIRMPRWAALVLLLVFLCAFDTSPRSRPRVCRFLVSAPGLGAVLHDLKGNLLRRYPGSPYDAQQLSRGSALITERQSGRVRIVGPNGKVLWEKTGLNGPTDADLLPNGHVLVLENGVNRVVEVDRMGKVVWEVGGLSNAYDVDRLANGNTLVADSGNNRLVEFDKKGRVVWQKSGLNFPNNVLRLRNGNTILLSVKRLSTTEDNS